MPATVGERDYTGAMNDFLRTAITLKFKFDKDDGPRLLRAGLAHESNVGVFRPMEEGHYHLACREGGTYAGMWEHHHQFHPWVSHQYNSNTLKVERRRIAPGMEVSLPFGSAHRPEGHLALWNCTSISREQIVLKQERVLGEDGNNIWKLSREAWGGLQMHLAKSEVWSKSDMTPPHVAAATRVWERLANRGRSYSDPAFLLDARMLEPALLGALSNRIPNIDGGRYARLAIGLASDTGLREHLGHVLAGDGYRWVTAGLAGKAQSLPQAGDPSFWKAVVEAGSQPSAVVRELVRPGDGSKLSKGTWEGLQAHLSDPNIWSNPEVAPGKLAATTRVWEWMTHRGRSYSDPEFHHDARLLDPSLFGALSNRMPNVDDGRFAHLAIGLSSDPGLREHLRHVLSGPPFRWVIAGLAGKEQPLPQVRDPAFWKAAIDAGLTPSAVVLELVRLGNLDQLTHFHPDRREGTFAAIRDFSVGLGFSFDKETRRQVEQGQTALGSAYEQGEGRTFLDRVVALIDLQSHMHRASERGPALSMAP